MSKNFPRDISLLALVSLSVDGRMNVKIFPYGFSGVYLNKIKNIHIKYAL